MLMTDEHALIGSTEGRLQMIEPHTWYAMRKMKGHTDQINCIVYCHELSMVITGSQDKTTRVWTVTMDKCVHVLTGHTHCVSCVAVHGTTYVHCGLLIDL